MQSMEAGTEHAERARCDIARALELLTERGWGTDDLDYLIFEGLDAQRVCDREFEGAICFLAQVRAMGVPLAA